VAARGAREATGGAAMKNRGRETTKLKGRNALPVARHRGPTAADLQKQLDQRTRELADAQKHLAEALEQQTATSEVFRSSAGDAEGDRAGLVARRAHRQSKEDSIRLLRAIGQVCSAVTGNRVGTH
jgi:hypothetical protein